MTIPAPPPDLDAQGKLTAHESVAEHNLVEIVGAAQSRSASSTVAKAAKAGGKLSSKGGTGKKVNSSKGKAAKAAAPAEAASGSEAGPAAAGDESAEAGPLPVLLLIDTAGCGYEEQQEAEGSSFANPGEAKAVMAHVRSLVRRGIPPQDIGIITAYNAQVGRFIPRRVCGWGRSDGSHQWVSGIDV
jgi:ATP-dependent RNA/DNA helicase IGHMBP2